MLRVLDRHQPHATGRSMDQATLAVFQLSQISKSLRNGDRPMVTDLATW
jgi:hypothetical protein